MRYGLGVHIWEVRRETEQQMQKASLEHGEEPACPDANPVRLTVRLRLAGSVPSITGHYQIIHHLVLRQGAAARPRLEKAPIRHRRMGRCVRKCLHRRPVPPMPSSELLLGQDHRGHLL